MSNEIINNLINQKVAKITSIIKNAESQFMSGKVINKSIPSDYRILFILFRNITITGETYTIEVGSIKEKIFYEAVNNFKYSVENFTNKNIQIIPTIKIINQNIVCTFPDYLYQADIISILTDLAPAGLYDAVISVSGPKWSNPGVTSCIMFNNDINNNYSFYGYSGCSISIETDENNIGKGYDVNCPYLVTTNIFIHEWLHQLEGFRDVLKYNGKKIIYPYTHAYYENYQENPTEEWMFKKNYKWDETYFNNKEKYPHVVERRLTSFYRAVLACDIEYIPNNNHKVGIYPEFWELTPNKIVLGRYIIQDSSSLYLYGRFSSKETFKCKELSNEIGFYWDIYYDINATNNNIKRKSCINRRNDSDLKFSDFTCFRVGIYEEGKYFIINKTLRKVLSFSVSNDEIIPKIEDYRASNFQLFNLIHYSNCFYKVLPVHNLLRFLDLDNDWDKENNIVKFQIWTGYTTAQTWQFKYINDECSIIPLSSTTRSLSYYDNNLHIVSSSNIQRWELEKADNGKFIFDGKYKIKDILTGKYLYGNESVLKLEDEGTEWIIHKVENNYYKICANINGILKYIDVLNSNNCEGNLVQIKNKNDNDKDETQKWKFILNSDNTVKFMSKSSFDKGLKSTVTSSTLSKDFSKYILFRIENEQI